MAAVYAGAAPLLLRVGSSEKRVGAEPTRRMASSEPGCRESPGASGGPRTWRSSQLTVLATGDNLCRPCADCGLRTGNFCETLLQVGHSHWQGGVCLAEKAFPAGDEEGGWSPGQRTPLCIACETLHGACHVCRRIPWCRPFASGSRPAIPGRDHLR